MKTSVTLSGTTSVSVSAVDAKVAIVVAGLKVVVGPKAVTAATDPKAVDAPKAATEAAGPKVVEDLKAASVAAAVARASTVRRS